MAEKMDERILENVLALAKLEIPEGEREEVLRQMRRMLDYVEKLKEPDTSNTEPTIHPWKAENVFREDEVTGRDCRDELLAGAPEEKDGQYAVPKTVE